MAESYYEKLDRDFNNDGTRLELYRSPSNGVFLGSFNYEHFRSLIKGEEINLEASHTRKVIARLLLGIDPKSVNMVDGREPELKGNYLLFPKKQVLLGRENEEGGPKKIMGFEVPKIILDLRKRFSSNSKIDGKGGGVDRFVLPISDIGRLYFGHYLYLQSLNLELIRK